MWGVADFGDRDPGSLPPVTRMVLSADGSTTRLLEALVGASLAVEVVEQWCSTPEPLPIRVRAVLGCLAQDEVVRRRSELRLADRPVSRNDVTVSCRDPELRSIFTDEHVPIGRGLDAAHRVLGRTVLATGWTSWSPDGDGEIDCVYKEYVLTDPSDRPVAHIRERFNPLHVPAGVR